jgi:beta-phosphoglucomutase-like phosphatase (HAD superfamily)
VHNGLLLSALWDAAFDRALVTFDDAGEPEFSPALSDQARAELRWSAPIPLTDEHRRRLARHRERAAEAVHDQPMRDIAERVNRAAELKELGKAWGCIRSGVTPPRKGQAQALLDLCREGRRP